MTITPSKATTISWAAMYVVSGICQPLIVTLCKEAGLADPSAQLYMFFYYLGPALAILAPICNNKQQQQHEHSWSLASRKAILMSAAIAAFDIIASAMNFSAASMAGPTVFSIIYSSVTIWTAVFSRILLKRQLSTWQWISVFIVFGGLCITASNSTNDGKEVLHGTLLVLFGSSMHGATYVMNEAILTVTNEQLTIMQNTAVQGTVAAVVMGIWQLVYTLPRYETLLGDPIHAANTTLLYASLILGFFSIANLLHSIAYYHTLKHYEGGATSAGVMKGLQAVLVFVACHIFYCGKIGGEEMCFTFSKLVALITVSGGVIFFGYLTEIQSQQQRHFGGDGPLSTKTRRSSYMNIRADSDEYDECVIEGAVGIPPSNTITATDSIVK